MSTNLLKFCNIFVYFLVFTSSLLFFPFLEEKSAINLAYFVIGLIQFIWVSIFAFVINEFSHIFSAEKNKHSK